MTTTIFYHGDAYELTQATSPIIVNVDELGLHIPQAEMSSCDMTYSILDNQLVLRDILVLNTNTIALGTNVYNGEVYRELAYRIPYTGKLLMVRDLFQHNLLAHYNNPFFSIEAYDTIRELIFEDGHMVCALDHSATMNALRTLARRWRTPNNQFDFLTNLGSWMQAIYGDDYDLWWMPIVA